MYTGEKLSGMINLIFSLSKAQLDAAHFDATLSEVVLRCVHERFLSDAYSASLYRQFSDQGKDTAGETPEPMQDDKNSGEE